MVDFALNQHWTFSQTAFILAKTISSVKRMKQDFAPFSDCLKQAKALMFKDSMKETDNLISQGRLQGYNIQTRDGINHTVPYTTGSFGKDTLQKLYSVPELLIVHNSTRLALLIRSPSDKIERA